MLCPVKFVVNNSITHSKFRVSSVNPSDSRVFRTSQPSPSTSRREMLPFVPLLFFAHPSSVLADSSVGLKRNSPSLSVNPSIGSMWAVCRIFSVCVAAG